MNFAPLVDSVLLMISFALSINAVSVEVSPVYFKMFPPVVNCTCFGSAFSGLISAIDLLYVAILFFGT